MLLMQGTRDDWQALEALSREETEAHVAFIEAVDQQLWAAGELVSEIGLTGPREARLVRAGHTGTAVMPASFAGDKAFLVGYWLVDCDSGARATEIAASLSASPGRGGTPLGLAIEVRPLMRPPGEEM
jgi:hypothetical protein